MRVTSLLIVCVVVTIHLYTVVAWGPLTHQTWACFLVSNSSSATTCNSTSPAVQSYILGGSSPDAVKALSMKLHSFPFAIYQLQLAQQLQGRYKNFDPVAFSIGYGSHLAQDAIGHYRTGYLTPEFDHPIELASDTYHYDHFYKPLGYKTFPFATFSDEAIDFITQANLYFANHTTFQPFSRDQLKSSISDFERKIMLEALFIDLNTGLYKQQMVSFDFCKASDYPTAEQHLALSINWSIDLSQYWIQLAKVETSPDQIDSYMSSKTNSIYQAHDGTIC